MLTPPRRTSVPALFMAAIAGCAHDPSVLSTSNDHPTEASSTYSWMLPKTTLEFSATWTFKGCETPASGLLRMPKTDVQVTVATRAAPDRNLGPMAPTGWLTLDAPRLQSFWRDSQIQVKTFAASHLLQTLSSTSTGQGAAIVNSLLTAAVKGVGILLKVPTAAGGPAPTGCDMSPTGAQAKYTQLLATQAALRDMDPTSAEGKAATAKIASLQGQLTFTVTAKADPGTAEDGTSKAVPTGGNIAFIQPTQDQLEKLGWLEPETLKAIRNHTLEAPFVLSAYLDFANANPPSVSKCATGAADCPRVVTPLSAGSMFREVAYVPLEIHVGTSRRQIVAGAVVPSKPIYKVPLPFAQFGIPRSLTLKSPIFGKTSWAMTFNETGEILEANWASSAIGVGASAAISGAASAASSIEAQGLKADSLLDPATQAQQLLNSKLQIWINGANLQQQCQTALAKGQVPQCD